MRFQRFVPLTYAIGICLCFFLGCQGNKPLSPSRTVALNIVIPENNEVKGALLGAVENEIIYRVDAPGHTAIVENTVGPFSTAASYGSEDLMINVPQDDHLTLSLQLNDASSHQPLALGAVGLNLLSSPVSDVVVEMGSVTRTCYFVNTDNPPTVNNIHSSGYYFSFESDSMPSTLEDIIVGLYPSGSFTNSFYFNSPGVVPIASVAYLGNGSLVDYDFVPPASSFVLDSVLSKGGAAATLQTGDIYCVELTSPAGAHAWAQVTDPGVPYTYGPAFIYRMNSTLPYYGYERTTADVNNTCTSY